MLTTVRQWPASVATRLGRFTTYLRRRNPQLRNLLPADVAGRLVGAKSRMTAARRYFVPIAHRSENTNIYHCCVHKTGSQWIKSLLTDVQTFRFCGLSHYHQRLGSEGVPEGAADHVFQKAFPENAIVSPLYISYDAFVAVPKPRRYKAFFVMRDPREMLVSWYFSAKDNHLVRNDPLRPLYQARKVLRSVPLEEGLIYGVDYLDQKGRFDAMLSWIEQGNGDPNVRVARYEELTGPDNAKHFRQLFDFLDIPLPDAELRQLLAAYSFSRLSGRKQGEESTKSHLRSGGGETWRRYISPPVDEYFASKTNDLVTRLGYA